ncbi:uncharacterized protein LOC124405899 [Diprion similis]|uniref:uncharacterized protein LOC124405899 n=1 Tax=Diprion similis TaxID=362088 RepID=UPI001EF8BD5B|nr:uncharacterized protein LOC124405899 [Diprion similis]
MSNYFVIGLLIITIITLSEEVPSGNHIGHLIRKGDNHLAVDKRKGCGESLSHRSKDGKRPEGNKREHHGRQEHSSVPDSKDCGDYEGQSSEYLSVRHHISNLLFTKCHLERINLFKIVRVYSDLAIESSFDISMIEMLPATEDPNSFTDAPLTEPKNELEMQISIEPEDPRSFIISQIEKLEKSATEFTHADHGEQALQVICQHQLQQLKFILDEVSAEKSSRIKPTVNYLAKSTIPFLNKLETGISFTKLIDEVGKFEIYDQDGQGDVGHVKSRYEDSSAPISPIQDEVPGLEVTDFFSSEKTNQTNLSEELDAILSDLQNQVNRMRKYFERVCKSVTLDQEE